MEEKGLKIAANCLVGKIALNKGVHIGLRATMQQVWRSIKEFKVESPRNNVFIFKFNSKEEKKRWFMHEKMIKSWRALAFCRSIDSDD